MEGQIIPTVAEQQFENHLDRIYRPAFLKTFSSTAPIRIMLITSREDLKNPTIIELPNIPSYYTINDILIQLWAKMNKDNKYAPANVFLGVPQDTNSPQDTWYVNAKTLMFKKNTMEMIGLYSPYKRIIYKDFVNSEGGRILNNTSDRKDMSIEDVFYNDDTLPVLHAYLLSGLLVDYGGRDAIDEKTWNGAVFPYYMTENPVSLKQSEKDAYNTILITKESQLKMINSAIERTESVIQEENHIHCTGIKQLTYIWSKKPVEFPGVDMIFYNTDVNEIRPFIRYYPRTGTVVNKLYQPNILESPYVNDPLLLQSWSAEKTTNPNGDFLFIKTELRKKTNDSPPLYGTFRINQDGSADFIMLPPKNVRVLNPETDLTLFYRSMIGLLEETTYKIEDAHFYRGSFVYALNIPMSMPDMNRGEIKRRISTLSRYFQIMDPLPGETPFISLRYKAVSNYTKEDNVANFITRYVEKGEDIRSQTGIEDLMKEFEISEEIAKKYITTYIEKISTYTIADNDEDKNFVALYNPGIDITIYKRGSLYTFHIYRVDSLLHLARLTTLLNVLMLSYSELWYGYGAMEEEEKEKEVELEEDVIEEEEEESYDENIDTGFFDVSPDDEGKESLDIAEEKINKTEDLKGTDCKQTATETLPASQIKTFLIDNLHYIDNSLTGYTAPSREVYSARCPAVDYRQPMALTKTEYDRMLKVYENDLNTDMAFITYGSKTWEKDIEKASNKKEVHTILRYGSNPRSLNYYFCSEYICVKDRILVRTRDFKSNLKRDGVSPKPGIDIKNIPESEWDNGEYKTIGSCPFCCGSLILNLTKPEIGQTVIQRFPKKNGKYVQTKIDFHSKSNPQGYGLPCCFAPTDIKKAKTSAELKYEHVYFKHIRDIEQPQESEIKKPSTVEQGVKIKDYGLLLTQIGKEYITDERKYPAAPGVVAKCNIGIDTYFGQNSGTLVHRDGQKQSINPQSYGFLRVGVHNHPSQKNNSLFSALAPILGCLTADEVISLFSITEDGISQAITPKVFANLNFGNLLLEFFHPGDTEPDNTTLESFSGLHMGLSIKYFRYELSRLYRSYNRFIKFLKGEIPGAGPKQYRQFFHILAEKGLLIRRKPIQDLTNGLTIIVLDYDGDPIDPTTRVNVRCPPYGFDMGRYSNNDITFLTCDKNGIWEPLIYVDRQMGGQQVADPVYRLSYFRIPQSKFTTVMEQKLPQNLLDRYTEFKTKCSKGVIYRGIYTSQTGVDSGRLETFSYLYKMFSITQSPVKGIIRDIYNHMVGVVVSANQFKPNMDVIIPASDDGYIEIMQQIPIIQLGFDAKRESDITYQYRSYADAYTVYQFYNSEMQTIITKNPDYRLKSLKCREKTGDDIEICRNGDIIGFILQNGIVLPCRPTSYNELKEKLGGNIPITLSPVAFKKVEFEFQINEDIIKHATKSTKTTAHVYDDTVLNREEFDDIYEHFRLSFSNWFRSAEAGNELRTHIRDLIMHSPSVSTVEKRRRMEYIFGPMLQSWLIRRDDDMSQSKITSIVRKDCRLILNRGECSGHCGWVESRNKCILHVPSKADIGSGTLITDVVEYFIYRLLYEIINIPILYREINEGGVSRINPLRTNIHLENDMGVENQWIIPDNVPAWHELLYNIKKETYKETPIFYEEFSYPEGLKAQEDANELLTPYFGSDIPQVLVLKNIGEGKTEESPFAAIYDVLVYYDLLHKIDHSFWKHDILTSNDVPTDEQLKNLSSLLGNHPVVFIEHSNPIVRYGFNLSEQSKKQNVYVIYYKLNDNGLYEASIVLPYGIMLDYIPVDMLMGSEIYNTIMSAPTVGKRFKMKAKA